MTQPTLMQVIVHNIKLLLDIKDIPIVELVSKTGLSRYQIDNILYCRSSNIETLQKIAQALDVSFDDLLYNDYANIDKKSKNPLQLIKNKGKVDPEKYAIIVKECKILLDEYKVELSHTSFEKWLNVLYLYNNMASSRSELRNIAKGILFYLIENVENPHSIKLKEPSDTTE